MDFARSRFGSETRGVWLGLFAVVCGVLGLVLAVGGAWLAMLGGSPYYVLAGLGLLACAAQPPASADELKLRLEREQAHLERKGGIGGGLLSAVLDRNLDGLVDFSDLLGGGQANARSGTAPARPSPWIPRSGG